MALRELWRFGEPLSRCTVQSSAYIEPPPLRAPGAGGRASRLDPGFLSAHRLPERCHARTVFSSHGSRRLVGRPQQAGHSNAAPPCGLRRNAGGTSSRHGKNADDPGHRAVGAASRAPKSRCGQRVPQHSASQIAALMRSSPAWWPRAKERRCADVLLAMCSGRRHASYGGLGARRQVLPGGRRRKKAKASVCTGGFDNSTFDACGYLRTLEDDRPTPAR